MKSPNKNNKKLKNILIIFLSFVFIFISFFLWSKDKKTSDSELRKQFVGIWQDDNVMAAGWGDRYHFYQDGTYSFITNSMNCSRTLEQIDGNWTVEKGTLSLNKNLVLERVGGKVIKDAICGTKLTGYTLKTIDVQSWCKTNDCSFNPAVSHIDKDMSPSGYSLLRTIINNKIFWKFYDDPNKESPAPIGGNYFK